MECRASPVSLVRRIAQRKEGAGKSVLSGRRRRLRCAGHAARGRTSRTSRPEKSFRTLENAAGHSIRIRDAITSSLDLSSEPAARPGQPLARRGHGSRTFILYNPFEWPQPGAGVQPGVDRDQMLLHELVHSLMAFSGLMSTVDFTKPRGRTQKSPGL